MTRIVSSIGVSLIVAFAFVGAAQSEYYPPPLPCSILREAPNVYVGQVLSMKVDDSKKEDQEFLQVEFLVRESFVGEPKDGKVVLRNSSYFADSIDIAVGRSFLVYAYYKQTGDSFAGVAPFTKSVEKAGAEMAFFRGLKDNPRGAWIFGSVNQVVKSSLYKNSRQPIPFAHLVVKADSDKKTYDVTTDADGNYMLENVPAGYYRVQPVLAGDSNLVSDGGQGTLVNNACDQADVDLHSKNSISGVVVDTRDKPVAKVPVELVPVDYIKPKFNNYRHSQETAGTNDDGSFTISNMPPGKYYLAVNYTILPEFDSPYPASFYPGTPFREKAQVIEIAPGKDIEGIKFILGPERLTQKKITGHVVFADGRPASDAEIYLKEDENEECCVLADSSVRTDAQGSFSLAGFMTRKYRVWTFVDHKPFTNKINFIGASPVFVLDNRTGSFQIVLRPTTKDSLDAIDEIEMRERGLLKSGR